MAKSVKPKSNTKPPQVSPAAIGSGKSRRSMSWLIWVLLVLVVAVAAWVVYRNSRLINKLTLILPSLPTAAKPAVAGKVISQEVIRTYSVQEVGSLEKQNYGADGLPAKYPVTQILMKYTSQDTDSQPIDEYARVYVPRLTTDAKIPMVALAPGTTGIGDECAASLEQPYLANGGNYASHAAAYAGQGYAVVIPDYEGMRDSTRIHHYMVGELEGRAVLDAAKAAYSLKDYKTLDKSQLFLAGYSQGGHAAAWADQIAASYAPGLKVLGVIGFAPVSDIAQTLSDVTRGSNIVWFGPFLMVSYADYYHQSLPVTTMLQAKWTANLKNDVLNHCINSVKYWTKPEEVYTPDFLAALKDNTLLTSNFPDMARDIAQNQPWQVPTATPKLINQGDKDIVILPDQQVKILPTICANHEPVQLQKYADATHYTVMVKSFKDTIAWMTKAAAGQPLPTSCVGT